MTRTTAAAALLLLAGTGSVGGQVVASERATLSQSVAGTQIVLDYSRPSARGREPLFGGVVKWGEVWTPGADMNTKLSVSKDVTLNGVEVPAGTYGVWVEVLEAGPWNFLLLADTTRFHIPHPPAEEAYLSIPVEPVTGTEFRETLTLDLQEIRADRARLTFEWGLDRFALDVGVDPGFVLTVAAAEADRYVGEWTWEMATGPSEEELEVWRESVPSEELEEWDAYWVEARKPRPIQVVHEEGSLFVYDPWEASFSDAPDLPI
ncbi:MAG TPA: DUF2911 domain-containing protein, partial [Longimicrobiales bacterium]|nr:DUF2911 domain-containing protein [Longimicrobiales bacterium]